MNLTDQLRDCPGMWVAVKDDTVLVAAPTPGEIVEWLRENSQNADSCFRVPRP